METTERVVFTNMCMVSDCCGNVLVQNRADKGWPGLAFPGGPVELGESFTDSVVREVYEETGLCISRLQMCGIKDWMCEDGARYVVLLYRVDAFSGEIASSDEGEVFWTPLHGLEECPPANGICSILPLFCNNALTEQFFFKKNGEWMEEIK